MDHDDTATRHADLLRQALRAQADRVDAGPDAALAAIRDRIAVRRRRRLPATLIATAAATVAATMVGVMVGLSPIGTPGPPGQRPGAATADPATSASAPAPASVAPSAAPGDPSAPGATSATATAGAAGERAGTAVATLPVYYVGEVDGRPRLYREFHRFDLTSRSTLGELRAVIGEMLTGERLRDPDYRTLWPIGASLTSVWTQYDIVGVNISGADVANLDAAGADAAVQQLAWTVAGVVGGDPRIRLLLDGEPVDRLWGHVDTRDEIVKGRAFDTLAALWLIEPQHGDTVGRTFTVHLAGSVNEATAQLRVRQGDRIVHQRHVTLDDGAPGRGEATVALTLPPGDYLVEAYEESLVEDGSDRYLVDAMITVR
ncbi:Gmad2 immunoglobulin-like domain-containing protein [Solwaraspora sp. WMMD406]|uniref:Gmad2 immunoglobulin-like domain-containing protein n=1 Tax=Solwaraspora sp. WMMD406 TaxID=3016095 RepID=UPI00241616E9|nr:Gmad2 immunoglobulin-like domain-containing protein [Solwaraspora sp. WMMD406]MDG4766434.1 Gmad2 immunoglobulin-like domain-containing protein [Solwaraspora sp. WMMD406]